MSNTFQDLINEVVDASAPDHVTLAQTVRIVDPHQPWQSLCLPPMVSGRSDDVVLVSGDSLFSMTGSLSELEEAIARMAQALSDHARKHGQTLKHFRVSMEGTPNE